MRILAFTIDASLEVALASLDDRFEIVAARDPEGALAEACRADLALVALGSTERGRSAVEALHRLRVGIPCLIVGDTPPGENEPAPVLLRPFSLGELIDAMVQAAQRPVPREEPLVEEHAAEESFADVPDPVVEAIVEITEPVATPEVEPDVPLLEEIAAAAATATEPEPQPELLGFPDHETVEELLRQLEAAAAAVPAAPATPPADPIAWALAALHEIETPASDAQQRARPLPAGVAPQQEATAARLVRHAAAAPRSGDWLADRSGERSGLHRLRRRRRTISLAGSPRAAIMRRVRSALEGARDLEALLDEIPSLSDPLSMARALVRETVELLGAETAALFAADPDGYRIAASHGLSAVEQSIVVPKDQALFCDVAGRMEAVLVAPVDLVRGLVSGIAGTTTEALMLAPLEVDGRCTGILLTGRARFGDEDLERLWHLAEEAAPGFAAARLVDRIRRRDLPVAL